MGIELRSAGRDVISLSEFQEKFRYNPEDGSIIRLVQNTCSRPIGAIATHSRNGRHTIKVKNYLFEAAHIAWLLFYGEWPLEEVDHIDRNPLNNRILNLRLATRAQNLHNTTARKNSKSGHKGVCKHSQRSGFNCYIGVGPKKLFLGTYPTVDLAAGAYRIASACLHGAFSGVV